MEKIKVFETFSGIGTQKMALDRLAKEYDLDFEFVGISEVNQFSILSYDAIHNGDFDIEEVSEEEMQRYMEKLNIPLDDKGKRQILKGDKLKNLYKASIKSKNFGDISKIDLENLPNMDLLTYSFPCFTKDNLVYTLDGYKPINEVKVGDLVLTHTGEFKRVLKVFNNGFKNVIDIKGMSFDEAKTTLNHKYFARKHYKVWNNKKRIYDRVFEEPNWIAVEDLKRNDYLGIKVNENSILPKWKPYEMRWNTGWGERCVVSDIIRDKLTNKDFWWLIGRYVADGWHWGQGGIVFGIGKHKSIEFENKVKNLFHYSKVEERTVYKYRFCFKELEAFVSPIGRGASNKCIPQFILDLPIELLKSFLDGYFDGDGFFNGKIYKCESVSRKLIYGLQACIAKVYKRPSSIYKHKRKNTTIIENRVVNQKTSYQLTFKKEKDKQDKAFYEDGYIWFPYYGYEESGIEEVFDLEIEDNHSFTVQNTIVHNCTDISGAGKQEGFLKGSNTRSSLLWECEKIIERKRPKYLLMENVKALVSKKFKVNFEEWIKLLDNLGYKTFYEVLDAKDYGVPQHRERVFAISILDENAKYDFPSKMPLSTRLRDILEKEVDEKYYLSDMQISKINLSNFNVNRRRVQEKTYCDTLCARDFKDPKCVRIYGLYDDEKSRHQAYSIWDENGLSPTLDTMKGGGREPHIIEDKNYSICASRGRFLDENGNRSKDGEYCQRLEVNTDGVSNTPTTVQKDNYVVEEEYIIGSTQKHASIRNDGISTTLTSAMGMGGGHIPMYVHNIKLPVIKRKYEVDIEKLKDILFSHKEKSNLTINEISRLLNKNKTTIEHYFRKDKSFAIPDKEIWLDLKNLLKIETDEFDESIMTFEVIEGVFDTSNRVYETEGISPTLTTITNPNILEDNNYDFKIRKLTPKECWRLMGVYDEDFEKAQKVVSNSQLYKQAGNAIVVDVMYYIFKNLFIERKES